MPDSKITALTSISTSTDPANDPLVIVDVSDTSMAATGTTKKVTLNQLLGASGTATLASATITGDLTVDTSTLKVDSANNRVGIRTASPAEPLTVDNTSGITTGAIRIYATDQSHSRLAIQNINGQAYHLVAGNPGTSNAGFALYDNTAGSTRWYVDNTGVHTFQNVGGVAGTAMTLNSTGLGVGASPTTKLDVLGSGDGELRLRAGSDAALIFSETAANKNWKIKPSGGDLFFQYSATAYNSGYSLLMSLNAAGNLGIGVQPSAWNTSAKAFEIGTAGNSVFSSGATFVEMTNNAYLDSVSNWVRVNTGNAAARFRTSGSGFLWLQAAAGANPITWTQAMTLDASGNLLVGTTGLNGSWNTKLTLSNDSGTTKWAVGPYLGGVTNFLISAGASAGVYLNGTAATSWTSASDERLKDIIEPISNAIAKVGSLRAVIGKFKFDENNTRKPFLIAQDIQAVLPEAVDASNPEKLGVAYTDVIPLLVAAIKELTAEVNALKNA